MSSTLNVATWNMRLGFTRKIHDAVRFATAKDLHVLALQEVGDPALAGVRMPHHTLLTSSGNCPRQGVALLLSADMRIVAWRNSTQNREMAGRLVAALVELEYGSRVLFVSAYMPTGLDGLPPNHEDVRLACSLYKQIADWSAELQATEVCILGDLNETVSSSDRHPEVPLRRNDSRPIASLLSPLSGFRDVFRSLNPSASAPGFTHTQKGRGGMVSQSRIDYIWWRDAALPVAPRSIVSCYVDSSLRHLSDHHAVVASFHFALANSGLLRPLSLQKLAPVCHPQLEKATPVQMALMEQEVTSWANQHLLAFRECLSADPPAPPEDASKVTQEVTDFLNDCAHEHLPMSGGAPLRSGSIMIARRKRRALEDLRRLSTGKRPQPFVSFASWKRWTTLRDKCSERFGCQWLHDADVDFRPWLHETCVMLRAAWKAAQELERDLVQLQSLRFQQWADRTRAVNNLIDHAGEPASAADILSVVNPAPDAGGRLTTTADELKTVLHDHYQQVFAVPPIPALPQDIPQEMRDNIPASFSDKRGIIDIDLAWYSHLLDAVSEEDLLEAIKFDLQTGGSAAGPDGVASKIWDFAIKSVPNFRSIVLEIINYGIRHRCSLDVWRVAEIMPLLKDMRKDPTVKNLRPISLQNTLGKITPRILALRLNKILVKNKILNQAQGGCFLGGDIHSCLNALLSAWEIGREKNLEQYTLFLDISQAFDSVQHDVLLRAMRRLRIPEDFCTLVLSMMENSTGYVRTAFGPTATFNIRRGIRQGCPLSPLLFIILMDGLHDALATDPWTGLRHGLTLQTVKTQLGQDVYLPSLGYSDDTTVLVHSLEHLRRQCFIIRLWLWWNRMSLNAGKCEIVGRCADSAALTEQHLRNAGIFLDGNGTLPACLEWNKPIRYLGVHLCFDGSMKHQRQLMMYQVSAFADFTRRFRLNINQAKVLYNTYLSGRINLGLHYLHGNGTSDFLKQLDGIITSSLRDAAGIDCLLSTSAITLVTGIRLPTDLEIATKASELFVLLSNFRGVSGLLSRMRMRHLFGDVVSASVGLRVPVRADASSWLMRAVYCVVHSLNWKIHILPERRALGAQPAGRVLRNANAAHVYDTVPFPGVPNLLQAPSCAWRDCTRVAANALRADAANPANVYVPIRFNCLPGWGAPLPQAHPLRKVTLHVCTDGSFCRPAPVANPFVFRSASTFSILDSTVPRTMAWLARHGSMEKYLKSRDGADCLLSTATFGTTSSTLSSNFAAELGAIASTLVSTPIGVDHLVIHTDSLSSISTIENFRAEVRPRARARTAGRPLLNLIHFNMQLRGDAGSQVSLRHVRAHSGLRDLPTLGNCCADAAGSRLTSSDVHPASFNLVVPAGVPTQLPLHQLEEAVSFITDFDQAPQSPDAGQHALHILNDVRQEARRRMVDVLRLRRWQKHVKQGRLAGDGLIELGRLVAAVATPRYFLLSGVRTKVTPALLAYALLSSATNCFHLSRPRNACGLPLPDSAVTVLRCQCCARAPLTPYHLCVCPSPAAAALQQTIEEHIISSLDAAILQLGASTQPGSGWLRVMDRRNGINSVFYNPLRLLLEHSVSEFERSQNGLQPIPGRRERCCLDALIVGGFSPRQRSILAYNYGVSLLDNAGEPVGTKRRLWSSIMGTLQLELLFLVGRFFYCFSGRR
jgi:exonuclease III